MNIKKIKPMFTTIVTTMDKYKGDVISESGLINASKQSGSVKEYQTVVAIGSAVRDINVGDVVCINPERYAVKKHKEGSMNDGIISDNPTISINFDIVELDGKPHLLLQDRDITFILEEFEE
jgi:hypothetical protein